MGKARQEILEKLNKASIQNILPKEPDLKSPLYPPIETPLSIAFKIAIEQIKGKASIFETKEELFLSLKKIISKNGWDHIFCMESELQQALRKYEIPFISDKTISENIEIGITGCEYLVARTGSAMVSSKQSGARQMFVYPPVHFIIAEESQLIDSLETAYQKINDKYSGNLPSMISLITGPSRTADIEKTLVLGAHGPKELHIFISK